jgi:hypothetical protein
MRSFLLSTLVLAAACSDSPLLPAAPALGTSGSGGYAAGAGAAAMMTNPDTQAGGNARAADAGMAGRDASTATKPPNAGAAGTSADDDAGAPLDASVAADGGAPRTSTPGTFKVFDKIPMFGMYRSDEPRFTPPAGSLIWSHGTVFVAKLTQAQQMQIGADLEARITYHAQCDNYDRLGGVFFIAMPHDKLPTEREPRTEIVRFITPFSDYTRGSLATYPFPKADIATYAQTLADPSQDVWIGIGGGSNPYDGDPCTNTSQPAAFKEVGYLYSLELASTKPLTNGASTTLTALYNVSAMRVPIEGTFMANAELKGRVSVIVSGHGAEAGGDEYLSTNDKLSLNGKEVGTFSTAIDCAAYAKFSPDGNQGIFRNNGSSNPRNWCPGSLVAPHTFEATLVPGMNTVRLDVSPSQVPSGSYYATSISFSSP